MKRVEVGRSLDSAFSFFLSKFPCLRAAIRSLDFSLFMTVSELYMDASFSSKLEVRSVVPVMPAIVLSLGLQLCRVITKSLSLPSTVTMPSSN